MCDTTEDLNGIWPDNGGENLSSSKKRIEKDPSFFSYKFFERAYKKWGDLYDLTNTVYQGSLKKITVKCHIHGEFSRTAKKFLAHGTKIACQQCERECRYIQQKGIKHGGKKNVSLEEVMARLGKKFENRFIYDFSPFESFTGPEIRIICPDHGEFFLTPSRHLALSKGCPDCCKRQTYTDYEELLSKFNEIYDSKYTYPDYNINLIGTGQSKIDIVCPNHGLFSRPLVKHLKNGYGCGICRRERDVIEGRCAGGYSEDYFLRFPDKKVSSGFLYYLNVDQKKYFKIGITGETTVEKRLMGINSVSRKMGVKTIEKIESIQMNLYEAFKVEQFLLNYNKDIRICREWTTELVSVDVIDQIVFFKRKHAEFGSIFNFDWEKEFYICFGYPS